MTVKYDANGNIINPWTSSRKQALDLLHRFGCISSLYNSGKSLRTTIVMANS